MTLTTTTDPVCGMQVDPAAAISVEHEGEIYRFCESVCADTFRDEPDRWIPQAPTV